MILPQSRLDAKNKVRVTNNLELEIYSADDTAGMRISDTESLIKIYEESKSLLETLGAI